MGRVKITKVAIFGVLCFVGGAHSQVFSRETVTPYKIMLVHIKKARTQGLPNCWYQSHARATEYAYERLTGNRINLSPNYFSANNMRAKALEALKNPSLPIKYISVGSWGSPFEIQMRYGLMITTPVLTPRRVEILQEKLAEIVGEFRKELKQTINSDGAYQRLLELYESRINAIVDNSGASSDQTFYLGNREYTPLTLAKTFPLDRMKWVVVQVGDRSRYLPQLPMISSYEEMISLARKFQNQKFALDLENIGGKRRTRFLLKTDRVRPAFESIVVPNAESSGYFGFLLKSKKSLEGFIHGALSNGLPVKSDSLISGYYNVDRSVSIRVRKDQKIPKLNWFSMDHGMVIVGIEKSKAGKVKVWLQNSWGPSLLGDKGLIKSSLTDLGRLINRLSFPVIITGLR